MAAQFQAEADRLTSVLRAADRAGVSPAAALQRALDAVPHGLNDWTALFTDVLSSVGPTAGQRLLSQWERDGLLPRGTAYDPARVGSQLAQALHSGGLPAQAAQRVVSTTQEALDGHLSQGIDASEIDDLITQLQQQYDDWQSGGRTESIADTQVVGGWSLGELDAAFQAHNVAGAQAMRTWNATMDARTRPEHAAADGQSVGLGEPFDVGGESLMYPCDPTGSAGNTINCRCSVSYDLQLATGDMSGADGSGDDTGE